MSSSTHWDAASPEDWAIATARENVIRPLVEAGQVPVAIAIEAARTLGISRSMLYRLIARFRAQAELSTLLPRSPGRTHQTHRLSKKLERLIATTIDEVYLQRERPRLADLMRVVNARCHAAGLVARTIGQVQRRVTEIDERIRTKRRCRSDVKPALTHLRCKAGVSTGFNPLKTARLRQSPSPAFQPPHQFSVLERLRVSDDNLLTVHEYTSCPGDPWRVGTASDNDGHNVTRCGDKRAGGAADLQSHCHGVCPFALSVRRSNSTICCRPCRI
jgi:hypothetical protein